MIEKTLNKKELNQVDLLEPLMTFPDEEIVPKQYVVFVEDGSCLQTCKNIRLDISEYMTKYHVKPPKNISRLPD